MIDPRQRLAREPRIAWVRCSAAPTSPHPSRHRSSRAPERLARLRLLLFRFRRKVQLREPLRLLPEMFPEGRVVGASCVRLEFEITQERLFAFNANRRRPLRLSCNQGGAEEEEGERREAEG